MLMKPRMHTDQRGCGARRLVNIHVYASLALVLLVGCSDGGPTTVPVYGEVTFNKSAPPAPGAVYFAPVKAAQGLPNRPVVARFGEDGSYVATSYEKGDGLVPGEYRVRVECWKTPPGMGGNASGVNYVGEGFEPPELVVTSEDDEIEFNLDVPLGP